MNIPKKASQFLSSIGWDNAKIEALAGDASFRRYFRIKSGDKYAMLMDAPPPHEDPKPFINVAQYLTETGFRAPIIYGADLNDGLVLIEDFGDIRMREYLDDNPDDEDEIYRQAIDIIIKLSDVNPANTDDYDQNIYLREVNLLPEWYLPAVHINADAAQYEGLWAAVLEPIYQAKKTTVLRDYHAENIMLLADGAMGIIDFQDALVGHQAYDLVSLLQDARRDVSEILEQKMLDYYIAQTNVGQDFLRDYAILGAQRNAKIIGIFARLCFRDGKEKYLEYLPRMWKLLERDLQHPALLDLKIWFDDNIPSSVRYAKIENRS